MMCNFIDVIQIFLPVVLQALLAFFLGLPDEMGSNYLITVILLPSTLK